MIAINEVEHEMVHFLHQYKRVEFTSRIMFQKVKVNIVKRVEFTSRIMFQKVKVNIVNCFQEI